MNSRKGEKRKIPRRQIRTNKKTNRTGEIQLKTRKEQKEKDFENDESERDKKVTKVKSTKGKIIMLKK